MESTPFVGREAERGRLRELLDDATRGRARVVAILGEAGIGKTRLVRWLSEAAAAAGARVLIGRSYASEQILPFGPWTDALRSGIADDPGLITDLDEVWRRELARLLPELPAPDGTRAAMGDDHAQLFEGVVQLVSHLSGARPLLVVLEDLHWADEMSIRLLAYLARRVAHRPLLLVATVREDELAVASVVANLLRHSSRDLGLVTLSLGPLSQGETRTLVHELARLGEATTVAKLSDQVWTLCEGHPFMAVEALRAVEQGTPALESGTLSLPDRVRQVVAARLDRLSESGRALLATAAVIGRDFEFTLLQRAAGLAERAVAASVEELVRLRMLRVVDERFEFTHDRIREVADGELLPPRRKLLHRHTAEAIKALHAEALEPHYTALATHCYAGEAWGDAVTYLRRAGSNAVKRGGNREAAVCFEQALVAFGHLADSTTSLATAIDLRLDVGTVLDRLGTFDRLRVVLDEAEALAERLGDPFRLGRVTLQRSFYVWRVGHPREAIDVAGRAVARGEEAGDFALTVAAKIHLSSVVQTIGDYARGAATLRPLVAMLEGERLREFGGRNAYVIARCHLAYSCGQTGAFAEALALADEAIRFAEQDDNRQALVASLWARGDILTTRRTLPEAVASLERALSLCHELSYIRTGVLGGLGYAQALAGRLDEGIALLREAIGVMEPLGWRYSHTMLSQRLGEALLLADDPTEAERVAARALAQARERGERAAEACVLRLVGVVAARRSARDVTVAMDSLRAGLALAEELRMRPLAAQCHRDLATLLGDAGKIEDARPHLEAARAMFDEMGVALGPTTGGTGARRRARARSAS